ncbi:MAG: hypothetical protein ACSHXL_02215 [Bacteroidota bacterium]
MSAKKERFYYSTNTIVLPGDHVLYRKIFREKVLGRVAYVPFKSKLNKEYHDGLILEWMIKLDDGYRRMIYNDKGDFVQKTITFVRRSDDGYNGI